MKFWNKKNNQKEQPLSLSDVLVKTVAGHYPASTVDDDTATLGDTGIEVACQVDEPQAMGSFLTVALYLQISGGPFGPEPSFASISGYAPWGDTYDLTEQLVSAVVTSGCAWTCTLLDILEAAGLIVPRESVDDRRDVKVRPALIGGRQFQVWSSTIDRTMTFGEPGPSEITLTRARLGGDSTMTSAVLASDTLPVHLSDHALLLGTFAMTTDPVTTEVKAHGGDWPPSGPALTAIGSDVGGVTMLRELAVAMPAEPARWDRDRLAATLAALGEHRTEPYQAAGWRGWRRHGGQLLAPLTDAQIAAAGVDPASLPADYHQFLTQVGWGAGPGYGLLSPTRCDRGLLLAHGGDGARWVLADDGVWADAEMIDGTVTRTHDTFTAWYADWLDNAVAGLQVWTQWDYSGCATADTLNSVAKAEGCTSIEDLRARLSGAQITLRSNGPDREPLDPCHGCQATLAQIGVGDEFWAG